MKFRKPASHVLVLAVGWLCAGMVVRHGWRESGDEATAGPRMKAGPRMADGPRRELADGPLARWMAPAPDPALAARLKREPLAEVALSIWGDWAGADSGELLGLLATRSDAGFNAMLAGFRALIETDPDGMRDWCASLAGESAERFAVLLHDERLAGAIPGDQLEFWEEILPSRQWVVRERGRRTGVAGDLESFDRLRKEAAADASRQSGAAAALMEAVAHWPAGRADDLVGRIHTGMAHASSGIQRLVERLPASERLAFLKAVARPAAGDGADPVARQLRQAIARNGPDIDSAERVAILAETTGADPQAVARSVIGADIPRLLADGFLAEDDPLHGAVGRLRAGTMGSGDLLRELSERFGPLAAGNEDFVRDRLFDHLARIAPEAAAGLYADEPAKMVQQRIFPFGHKPADFEAVIGVLRAREPEEPGQVQERFSYWGHRSRQGVSLYGDAYPAWVLAGPRSLERDLALGIIAILVEKEHPVWADELRAAKSFQSGWTPGMK